MGAYLRLLGSLVQNLARRLGEDLADCAVVCRRGVVYKLRSIRLRYDDVGPASDSDLGPDWQPRPHQLAALVESVRGKPWFCDLDRKSAQDLVHDGGPGCFLVRPSASTRSLTLTVWHRHRAYNILVRQREDGLLALGSWKNQEMTFRSVEEMVRYYEREPLILYSGGELAGTTRLKAPPPGLVRSPTTKATEIRRSSSAAVVRRSSGIHSSSDSAGLRTLSFGSIDVPFSALGLSEDSRRTSAELRTVPYGSAEVHLNSPRLSEHNKKPPNTTGLRTVSFGKAEVPCDPRKLLDEAHSPSVASVLKNVPSKNTDDGRKAFSTEKVQKLQNILAGYQKTSSSVLDDLSTPVRSHFQEEKNIPFDVSISQTFSSEVVKHPKTKANALFNIYENVQFSRMRKTYSSENFLSPSSSQINNRFAISTPNIDISDVSNTCTRRRSCDSLMSVSPPPTLAPRSPSSFKETQQSFVKPFVKSEPSSSLIRHIPVPETNSPSPPVAVHTKVSNLSFFTANSSPDCSC